MDDDARKGRRREELRDRTVRLIFHSIAILLVLGATLAAIVNNGLGWSPSPELVSNQVYDATILRLVKHLVENPQIKLPFLAYEGAVWLKSTTAAQLLLSLMSMYLGMMLPGWVRMVLPREAFDKLNRYVVLSTVPALILSIILHVFVVPIPPPPSRLHHGDWLSGYLQRMLPAFLAGWSFGMERFR